MTAGSAGNHAQALAFAAKYFGVPCEIFVPAGAPISKIEACRSHGATVIEGGSSVDEAIAAARELAERDGKGFCHPYDDPAVVAGQGTLGLELVEDLDDLQLRRRPDRRRRACQRRGDRRQVADAPRPRRRRAGGGVQPLRRRGGRRRAPCTTLADGIAVKHPGALTRPLVEHWVDDIVTVDRGRHRRRDGAVDGPGQAVRRGRRRRRRRRPAGPAPCGSVGGGHTCVVLSGGNVDLGVVPGLIRRHETTAGTAPRRVHEDRRPARRPRQVALRVRRQRGQPDRRRAPPRGRQPQRPPDRRARHVRGARTQTTPRRWSTPLRRPDSRSRSRPEGPAKPFRAYLLVGRLGVCFRHGRRRVGARARADWSRRCSNATLAASKEWFPHEVIPYSRGRDAVPGEEWTRGRRRSRRRHHRRRGALVADRQPAHRGQPARTTSARSSRCSAPTGRGARGRGAGPPRRVATRWRSTAT